MVIVYRSVERGDLSSPVGGGSVLAGAGVYKLENASDHAQW